MHIGIAFAAASVTALAVIGPVRAGADKVVFPENHAQGVLYATVDRPDNKQFRELYVNDPAALEAAKKGATSPTASTATSRSTSRITCSPTTE
jgi:hypothetical protein